MSEPAPFEFSGGALCLDFANTLGDRPKAHNETLLGFADLVRWGREAGLLDGPAAARLLRDADAAPREAARLFRRALGLREAIYRIFSALAAGRRPVGGDLEALNTELGDALRFLRVRPAGDRFTWDWREAGDRAETVLWPVVRSAAELLTSDEASHLRECAAERCGWLFVDRSRGARRRWCDMKTCGNRAKARRHYHRQRRGAAPASSSS